MVGRDSSTLDARPPMRPLRSAALVLILFAVPAQADDLDVLPRGPGEPARGKRLDAYLQAQAKVHFDARRKAVAALKTPEDILRRQAALKASFREALGELPV